MLYSKIKLDSSICIKFLLMIPIALLIIKDALLTFVPMWPVIQHVDSLRLLYVCCTQRHIFRSKIVTKCYISPIYPEAPDRQMHKIWLRSSPNIDLWQTDRRTDGQTDTGPQHLRISIASRGKNRYSMITSGCGKRVQRRLNLKPNSITLASSELAPNMFEAGSCQIPLHWLVRSQLRTS